MSEKRALKSFILIGPGQVGITIAHLLLPHLELKATYGRSRRNNRFTQKWLNKSITPIDQLQDLNVDLVIFTPPDQHFLPLVDQLSGKLRAKLTLHCSGMVPADILSPLGTDQVVLHPMMSFISIARSIETLKQHTLTLQGTQNGKTLIKPLLQYLSHSIHEIEAEQKQYLHLSAVMVNNFTTLLMETATDLLKKSGFDKRDALMMLLPLLQDSIDNLRREMSPLKALSGPIKRDDTNTINNHLNLLKEIPEAEALYHSFLAVARRALEMA